MGNTPYPGACRGCGGCPKIVCVDESLLDVKKLTISITSAPEEVAIWYGTPSGGPVPWMRYVSTELPDAIIGDYVFNRGSLCQWPAQITKHINPVGSGTLTWHGEDYAGCPDPTPSPDPIGGAIYTEGDAFGMAITLEEIDTGPGLALEVSINMWFSYWEHVPNWWSFFRTMFLQVDPVVVRCESEELTLKIVGITSVGQPDCVSPTEFVIGEAIPSDEV